MMFSGQNEKEVVDDSMRSGANKHMLKPAPLEDI